jgi:hypothetical protein
MRIKTKEIIIIILAILLFMFIFNLCGFADIVTNAFDNDDEKDDDEEEEEEPEEEEEEDEPAPHCSTVNYVKTQNGATEKWTAVGMPEATYLERTSQIAGGYKWSAYWNKDPMGHISPEYNTRFTLLTWIRAQPSSDIYSEQVWWYECMITTGYGGIF